MEVWRSARLAGCIRCLNLWRNVCNQTHKESAGSQQGSNESCGKEIKVATKSLRIDAVAAAGLGLSRKKIWELSLYDQLMVNGKHVEKKSKPVAEGDIVEVDEILEEEGSGTRVKRGRVVVQEIGSRTKRGGYHLTLIRYKQYAIFHRNLSSFATHVCILSEN